MSDKIRPIQLYRQIGLETIFFNQLNKIMEIKINLLEAASELAHEFVCAKFEYDDNAIYESTSDAITNYTEDAQDLFNEWYDHYYTLLNNIAL